ncbi:MAG: metallopeptidase TldD-related protein, partial [Planctomycetota bacterium]
MDLKVIQNVLHARHDIAQWQVTELRVRRNECYLTFLKPESERETASVRWHIWIALPADGELQGEASCTITPADGGADLRTKLTSAIQTARAALNPAWSLPGPADPNVASFRRGGVVACEGDGGAAAGALLSVSTDFFADPHVVKNPRAALASRVTEFTNAVHACPWVRPSAIELFASIHDRRLVNHLGVDLSERRTRCYAEFVLLHRPDGGDEVEFYDHVEAASLAGLRLTDRVAEAASCLRDGATATAPPSGIMPVVIANDYLSGLFGWYATHADAALHVRKVAVLALDAPVVERQGGERLNLVSDAKTPSLAAYRFDEHGYAACRQELIIDDVLTGLHGSGRWMQVLGRPPRGQQSTLVVPPGSMSLDQLRGGALEVVRFSEFR